MKINEFLTNTSSLILAHRGDSVEFPENTLPSFESAVKKGAHIIETDIHITKDSHIVVWHDDDFKCLNGSDRLVPEYTLEEIMELDAGSIFTLDGGKTFPFKGKGIKRFSNFSKD